MAPKTKLLSKAPFIESVSGSEFVLMSDETKQSDFLNFGDTSPATMFQVPPNTLIKSVTVEVIAAFNGVVPSIALGVSGTTNRHVSTNDVDLSTIGLYPILDKPFLYAAAAQLIATYVAGGSSAGQLRFWVTYRSRTDRPGL